ncbi:MAG: methionyl-tRNA formyltransferase [Pirellulales bacterium]|nr:methionyl-tRNA formyltransferase [Pirellulales bacterium]
MRLIILANGPFALPMLHALDASRHPVLAVVVRPPRLGQGRHRHPHPSPIELAAKDLGLEVFAPSTVNTDEMRRRLRSMEPDLLMVCDYGEILRDATLAIGRLGSINLHGSLLPKYRGAAPVAWAIYHGETETGTTVFQVTPGVDAGPILGQRSLGIDPDETAGDLEARLADQGAILVTDVLDQIDAGTAQPLEQNAALASRAPRLSKANGQIDWARSATAIKNQVRAMQPWPRAFTTWLRPQGDPLRLILTKTVAWQLGELDVLASGPDITEPGTVLEAGNRLLIATGDGMIEVIEIQPAGKRIMSAAEFLRGHTVQPGHRFG